jgi:hypothetical protein
MEISVYNTGLGFHFIFAPDGKPFDVFPVPDAAEEPKDSVQVTFLLNFFDEIGRCIPQTR